MISIVLPVRDERENLVPLVAEIADALADVPHEIIAVDDSSTDGSGDVLRGLARGRINFRVLQLAAQAGQSAACAAGFDEARGEIVVTMDADRQNDPRDIPAFLHVLRDPTIDAAVGYRVVRRDSRWKLVQSRVANAARNWITGDSVRDTGCSLKAIRVLTARRLPRFDGMHRFIPTLVRQGGGRVVELPVNHRQRQWGSSKYGMWDRLWRGLRDAFGVRWLAGRALTYSLRDDV